MKRRRLLKEAVPLGHYFVLLVAFCRPSLRAWSKTCDPSNTTSYLVQSSADVLTLNDAVNCSDGGYVDALWSGSVNLASTISIGTGTYLTVTGEDGAEAVGDYGYRMFRVRSGAGLNISSVRLTGGVEVQGGAISAEEGIVRLENCEVDNNMAIENGGGAIYTYRGELTIVDCNFHGNKAYAETTLSNGGAVFANGTKVTVRGDTRFELNSARAGGAIYSYSSVESLYCLIEDTSFVMNEASSEEIVIDSYKAPWDELFGGGALMLDEVVAEVRNCTFERNSATPSGGALFGTANSTITVYGTTFRNNSTPGYGGAVAASTVNFADSTIEHNSAEDGAGVFGTALGKDLIFSGVTCSNNTAGGSGGCLYASGDVVIQDESKIRNNEASSSGGCIYAADGSSLVVKETSFTSCTTSGQGGLLYTTGGNMELSQCVVLECSAEEGGVAYFERSRLNTSGGEFSRNEARDGGGVFYALDSAVLNIDGGLFSGNKATRDGGFAYLDEEAVFNCEGASIEDSTAGNSGGAIYALGESSIYLKCNITGSTSPSGAGAYLSAVSEVVMRDMVIANSYFSCGSGAIYGAEESVLNVTSVTFAASSDSGEDPTNSPVQIDSTSVFRCESCNFIGWDGDTVIFNQNSDNDSLTLDNCDFAQSSPSGSVVSSSSPAKIRNARVDELTFSGLDDPPSLVNNVLSCSDLDVCEPGKVCMDSELGVMCECFPSNGCLDDGGSVSLTYSTDNDDIPYSAGNDVTFKLVVAATDDGTTDVLWDVSSLSDYLRFTMVPSTGVLPPGRSVTISVVGEPSNFDARGGRSFSTTFQLNTVGSRSDNDTTQFLVVDFEFYYCQSYEFAVGNEDANNNFSCKDCLDGDLFGDVEGVNCTEPGSTLSTLLIRSGYWRESSESYTIRECLFSGACQGGSNASSADDYCNEGYEGPYCAVCSKGYGQGSDGSCYKCSGERTTAMIVVGSLALLLLSGLVVTVLVFLIGGLEAFGNIRRSIGPSLLVTRKRTESTRSPGTQGDGGAASSFPESSNPSIDPHENRNTHRRTAAHGEHSRRTPEGGVAEWSPVHAGRQMGGIINERRQRSVSLSRSGAVVVATRGFATRGAEQPAAVSHERRRTCCKRNVRIRKWISKIPFGKLRILIVVWQILTVYPTVASVEYPDFYRRFLNWIDFVNLDLGSIFSASCVIPGIGHHETLLVVTLGPLVIAFFLVLTYRSALARAGVGTAGEIAKRAAWTRHMAAGLLVSFLVFTSSSTVIFQTFVCDSKAIDGEEFLRADYRISCEAKSHLWYEIYAGVMFVVYPVGIPTVYAIILWKNREILNPQQQPTAASQTARAGEQDVSIARRLRSWMKTKAPRKSEDATKEGDNRRLVPELAPSMLLWKDYCPDLYYYEVIECGRRILLTGALVFILPNTTEQTAIACIFAFASLLGFELLRPHMDSTDAWLYRLGCVIIFLSNFLALLIKVQAGEEGRRDLLAVLLVFLNVSLFVAVAVSTWLTAKRTAQDPVGEVEALELATSVVGAERVTTANLTSARSSFSVTNEPRGPGPAPISSGAPARPQLAPRARSELAPRAGQELAPRAEVGIRMFASTGGAAGAAAPSGGDAEGSGARSGYRSIWSRRPIS